MNSEIDGRRLDNLRKDYDKTQRELAEGAGVTRYTISRWCSDGGHRVRHDSLRRLAKAFGMTIGELLDKVSDQETPIASRDVTELSAAEAEWLRVYRSLSPLHQAKARVALEEIIQGLASPA